MLSARALFLPLAIAALGGCASCPHTGSNGAAPSGPGRAAAADSPAPANAIPVRIDGEGRAYVRDQPMYKSEDFAKAIGTTPNASALVTPDPGVPYGRVAQVVDDLRHAGVSRVDFASGAAPAPDNAPTASSTAAVAPAAGTPAIAATSESSAPPPADAKSLPEVKIESVGLHVGGGPNDDATKSPFLKTVEARFDEFRSCYVKVVEPEKGGTFGVDMRIGRTGGRAKIEQPRTGMKGTEFRQCVMKVFESLEFEKPARGPTTISYSLKFTLLK